MGKPSKGGQTYEEKALSLILASAMVLSLAACGSDGGAGDSAGSTGAETSKGDTANAETPSDGAADSNAASASDMNIAMITDSGDITTRALTRQLMSHARLGRR